MLWGRLAEQGAPVLLLEMFALWFFCSSKSIKATFTTSNEALAAAGRGVRREGGDGLALPAQRCGDGD